jgi:hypothetical protein
MYQVVCTAGPSEFSKRLPHGKVDPLAQTVAVFDIIGRCYAARKLQLKAGRAESEMVRRSAIHLLNRAHCLARLGFWNDLTVSETIPWDLVPEPGIHRMRKRIAEARSLLMYSSPTAQDLLEAMDTVNDAFRTMGLLFTYGYMPSGGLSSNKRYFCAASLHPVVDLLNRVWLPIRLRIAEKDAGSS